MCEVCIECGSQLRVASELADPVEHSQIRPQKPLSLTKEINYPDQIGIRLWAKSKQSHSLVQQKWTASILVLFYMCKGAGQSWTSHSHDSGFVANVINQKAFSVFPKHLPGVGAFGKGDASHYVTSFSAARGFHKLSLISNDSMLFALNCAACWNALPDQVVLHFKDNDTFSDKGLCSLVEGQWYMLQSHVQLHQARVRFHKFESRPMCFCKVLL